MPTPRSGGEVTDPEPRNSSCPLRAPYQEIGKVNDYLNLRVLSRVLTAGMLMVACFSAARGQQAGGEARVTVSMRSQPAAGALAELFQRAGAKYRLDVSEVRGTVTADLRDVPLTAALRSILRQAQPPLTFRREGDTWIVYREVSGSGSASPGQRAVQAVTLPTTKLPRPALPALPRLDATTFGSWRQYLENRPEEVRWQRIPWRPTLWEAVVVAERQLKPILLWSMDGHPLCDT